MVKDRKGSGRKLPRGTVVALIGAAVAGVSAAAAASCGGDSEGAKDGSQVGTAEAAFVGTWTFSSGKPVLSCKGQPLDIPDMKGKSVTIESPSSGTIVYHDLTCAIPLRVSGSTAQSSGPPPLCPATTNGLATTIESLKLSVARPGTLSVSIAATLKGSATGHPEFTYDCTISTAGEIERQGS